MKTCLLSEKEENANFNFKLSDDKELKITCSNENIEPDILIVENTEYLNILIKSILNAILVKQNSIKKKKTLILFVDDLPDNILNLYSILFKNIIILKKDTSLPVDEVIDIIQDKKSNEFVIGSSVSNELNIITLIRGDLSKMLVPFSAFRPTSNGVKPNFKKVSIEDYGQTIKLGNYESSVDAILYEYDNKYRNKLKKQREEKDNSFGACLKRLRIQKRILQSDFDGISDRQIRRIENNEYQPTKKNLTAIMDKLGVNSKEEILSY